MIYNISCKRRKQDFPQLQYFLYSPCPSQSLIHWHFVPLHLTNPANLQQHLLSYSSQNVSSLHITPLQRIQNTLAHVCLYKAARTEPSKSLLASLHWLPISERVIYKTACITHTLLHTKEPSYLLEHLNKYAPVRQLRSSSANFLKNSS